MNKKVENKLDFPSQFKGFNKVMEDVESKVYKEEDFDKKEFIFCRKFLHI